MNNTPNINLSTYTSDPNDKFNLLVTFNNNMTKIDTAIGSQNDAIDVIEETAGTAVTTANTASATAEEALTTAEGKTSINDNVASATTTYSSNKINELISEAGGAVIDDTETSADKTWSSSKINTEVSSKASINDTTASNTSTYSSNKINTELSAKAGKISYDNTTSTTLTFNQDETTIQSAKVNNLSEGYYYFDIKLGINSAERCAYFEIKKNNTVKYSRYYYKNPVTSQVTSEIIYIPAGYSITISAISKEAFTSNTTGNLIKVG